jgi:4-hydroxyphenylpyruvate dioxygenase-like putative hemolysin
MPWHAILNLPFVDNEYRLTFPLFRRKSQILTFLEQNEGPGLQHLALKTTDIFSTVKKMREMEENSFGFELMKKPSEGYYRELPDRLGDQLTVSSLPVPCIVLF